MKKMKKMKKLNLFDDGKKTYQTVSAIEWSGQTTITPFGIAAYISDGPIIKPATERVGGWFGNPNGRTWSQLFPVLIGNTPDSKQCDWDINSQDIVRVSDTLGGGFVSFGRHDFGGEKKCFFGEIFRRRISVSEAKHGYGIDCGDQTWYAELNRTDLP